MITVTQKFIIIKILKKEKHKNISIQCQIIQKVIPRKTFQIINHKKKLHHAIANGQNNIYIHNAFTLLSIQQHDQW